MQVRYQLRHSPKLLLRFLRPIGRGRSNLSILEHVLPYCQIGSCWLLVLHRLGEIFGYFIGCGQCPNIMFKQAPRPYSRAFGRWLRGLDH